MKHSANYAGDITGQQFHRLLVLSLADVRNGQMYYLCQCNCGQLKTVNRGHLRLGRIRSCGCLRDELIGLVNKTFGHTRHPDAQVYQDMIARCYNPNATGYEDYGGRGIQVCERWKLSPLVFFEDMGPRPSKKHSIDRKDNDGNYEPLNCHWATKIQQARNTTRTLWVTVNDETHSVAEWAEKLGMKYGTIHARIVRGIAPERAITSAKLKKISRLQVDTSRAA